MTEGCFTEAEGRIKKGECEERAWETAQRGEVDTRGGPPRPGLARKLSKGFTNTLNFASVQDLPVLPPPNPSLPPLYFITGVPSFCLETLPSPVSPLHQPPPQLAAHLCTAHALFSCHLTFFLLTFLALTLHPPLRPSFLCKKFFFFCGSRR